MTVSNTTTTMTIESGLMGDVRQNLEMYLMLLQNGLDEDYEENCKTQRLTARQCTMLPLFCKLVSAHASMEAVDAQELIGDNIEEFKISFERQMIATRKSYREE